MAARQHGARGLVGTTLFGTFDAQTSQGLVKSRAGPHQLPREPACYGRRMRRLVVLLSSIVALDIAFFAALTPLLPHFVSTYGLSKAAAGVLSASYAAGVLAASLPSGLAAARYGPRNAALAGVSARRGSQRRLRLRRQRLAARCGALPARRRQRALLVGRARVAGRGRAAGAPRRADRHGDGRGRLRCAVRAGDRRDRDGRRRARDLRRRRACSASRWRSGSRPRRECRRSRSRSRSSSAAPTGGCSAGCGCWCCPRCCSACVAVLVPLRLHDAGWGGVAIGAVFLDHRRARDGAQPAARPLHRPPRLPAAGARRARGLGAGLARLRLDAVSAGRGRARPAGRARVRRLLHARDDAPDRRAPSGAGSRRRWRSGR